MGDGCRRVNAESAHVDFVDDGVFHRRQGRTVLAPVEAMAAEDAAPGCRLAARLHGSAPDCRIGERRGRGVEQDHRGVEAVTLALGSIDPPAVRERIGQTAKVDVPMVPRAVPARVQS